MKNLLIIILFTITCQTLFAQNDVKNGDITIRISGTDVWGEHPFLIDIIQKGKSVKIKYAFCDSINSPALKKDLQYQDVNKRLYSYKRTDPKDKLVWDTIGRIFEKHRAYTRNSKRVNLKTDTGYSTLLQRVGRATKQELIPKARPAVVNGSYIITTDGPEVSLTVITSTEKKVLPAYPPLIVGFIKQTLDKKRNSNAVKKILNYYSWYQINKVK